MKPILPPPAASNPENSSPTNSRRGLRRQANYDQEQHPLKSGWCSNPNLCAGGNHNSQSEQLTTSRTVAKSATSTNIARRWTSIQSGYYRNIMSQLSYRKKVYLDDDLLDVKGGLGCHPESSLKLAFVSREKQPQRASAQAH